jgi:hypothetical protein
MQVVHVAQCAVEAIMGRGAAEKLLAGACDTFTCDDDDACSHNALHPCVETRTHARVTPCGSSHADGWAWLGLRGLQRGCALR